MQNDEMNNFERNVFDAAINAISHSIDGIFKGYNSPLQLICKKVVDKHSIKIESIIDGAIEKIVYTEDFETEINAAFNKMLARLLIEKMGGELEKSVNKLKSDPTTRAKITVAIDKIISESK